MQQEVEVTIAIDIHHRKLYCSCFSAMFPKTDFVRIHRVSVEVGIRENGDRDDAIRSRVDRNW